MNEHTDSEPTPIDRAIERRDALRHRHTQALVKLMGERADLHGVHPLADFVADALRWSA